jgi:hypothetical protein
MSGRLMLAALTWNNKTPVHEVDETGKPKTSMYFSKRQKAFLVRYRYSHQTSNIVQQLVLRTYEVHESGEVLPPLDRPHNVPMCVSGEVQKPEKSDLDAKYRSRLSLGCSLF